MITQMLLAGFNTKVKSNYLYQATNTGNLLTYSFDSVPFGDPAADRDIYIFCFGERGGGGNITGCTVAGNPATKITSVKISLGDFALYKIRLPTGTTGNITFTLNDAQRSGAIIVYSVTGAKNDTPLDLKTNTATGSTATSISIDGKPNGVIIAAIGQIAGTNTSSLTWIGANEDVDYFVENSRVSSARIIDPVNGVNVITATQGTSVNSQYMIGVSIE